MIRCPCGGKAYSRDEMVAMAAEHDLGGGELSQMWRSILGPMDYYCPDEDDVLLASEVARELRGPWWWRLRCWLSDLLMNLGNRLEPDDAGLLSWREDGRPDGDIIIERIRRP